MTLPDDYSVSEIWRSLEDEGKRVRAERRATAPEQLRAAGVAFTLNNNGAHLVITVCPGLVADFWPGTELWRRRGTPTRRYGLDTLLQWVSANRLSLPPTRPE